MHNIITAYVGMGYIARIVVKAYIAYVETKLLYASTAFAANQSSSELSKNYRVIEAELEALYSLTV